MVVRASAACKVYLEVAVLDSMYVPTVYVPIKFAYKR
jgi:hypothetical protein